MKIDHSELPYGKWVCADGSSYLFNRYYQPIYRRCPDGVVEPADRSAWIDWTSQVYFYNDASKPSIVKHIRLILENFINSGKQGRTGAQS